MFRDLSVVQSYSFEASFKGSNEQDHFEIPDYEKMGHNFFKILGNYLVKKYHVSASNTNFDQLIQA